MNHHLGLLFSGGFIDAIDASSMDGKEYIPQGLTWKGADLIDDIRSEAVWSKTKAAVLEQAGSVSVTVLQAVAQGIAKALFGLP